MHLVFCEILRSRKLFVPKHSTAMRGNNRMLQSAAWAIRTSVHMITKYSPGQLFFQQNMIIHKKLIADWDLVYTRRKAQQIKDNDRENKSRTDYKFKAGDRVRVITTTREIKGKLQGFEYPGPYEITRAHNNGIVTILFGNFLERISI